jgi:UDP-N-acetylglucosamine transferase subunit ALG13
VDAAWHEVNTEGRQDLIDQEEDVEDHASGSPCGAKKLDLEAQLLLVRDGNETRNEVLDTIQIGITEQLALLNENLACSQALMRGAQQLQEETVRCWRLKDSVWPI